MAFPIPSGLSVSNKIAMQGEIDFSKTSIAASGTLTLINNLFGIIPGAAQGIRILELHLKTNTALNGSVGSNLDVRRQYGPTASLSTATILTSAGAIACDAAIDTRQIFSTTTGTKLINGAHPEDGSLSVATLDQAHVFRMPGTSDILRIQLQYPGAAAITSGKLAYVIVVEFANF